MKNKSYFTCWMFGMGIAILLLFLAAMVMGRYTISIRQILMAFFPNQLKGWGTVDPTVHTVIFDVRLPRIFLALLSGAGLSVAGAAFQGLFSNPLATPDTLGVATGASFGAVLGILFGFSALQVQLLALCAGMFAVILVYFIGSMNGNTSIIMIILSGMVISALFSAMVSLVKYVADPQDVLPTITFWLMGSFSGTTKQTLMMGAPLILIGSALIFVLRFKINALSLPEDETKSLGINIKLVRFLTILGATMITASVVSMCGQIGWVGLLIPHISRMLFGNNNKQVIPASILLGAIFMVIVDTLARCATASEIPDPF
jgi:iron complex transport system permease protein